MKFLSYIQKFNCFYFLYHITLFFRLTLGFFDPLNLPQGISYPLIINSQNDPRDLAVLKMDYVRVCQH